ncbi:MAG: MscL family protein [Candidatus Hermodarchaeota archaeon]
MTEETAMLEELKKIRELLSPPPSPPPPKNLLDEFKRFIKNYKVMGLAVAFIMGIYLGRLVTSLVTAFISPILNNLFLLIGFLDPAVAAADPASYPLGFNATLFISELITFIIVAFVIFILVKITKRLGID